MKSFYFSIKIWSLLPLIVLAINPHKANAAKGFGFVVISSGDTLKGTIYHRGFDKMIKVTLVQNGSRKEFSPQEIASFRVQNQLWESIHLAENGSRPDQHLFLRTIAQGSSQLLKGRYIVDGCGCDDFPKNALSTGYFLKRPDGKVTQVFLKTLSLLDDPEYLSRFLKTPELSKTKWVGLRKLKRVVEDT